MKKKLRISFNGKTYDVVAEVLDDEPAPGGSPVAGVTAAVRPEPAAALNSGPATAARANAGDGTLPSPLAGKVVSIEAKVGTRVNKDQPVVTLEAMKMNTIVSAPTEGSVTAVHVNVGDSVEEGQPLLTIA
jgi:biotin carboxyl carrier protein